MARKIYRTKNEITSYGIGLVIPNKKDKVYVYFTGGVTHPKFIPSTYETSDPEIQEALEKAENYNKKFELAATFKEEAPAKKTVEPAQTPQDPPVEDAAPPLKAFNNTSIQSAVVTLIKQGWAGTSDAIVSIEDVQEAGRSIGICFPNLK